MTLDQRCTADSGVCETCGQVRHSLLYQHDTMLYVPRHDIHPYVPRPCGAVLVQEQGPFTGAPWVCERGHVL